MKQTNNFKIVFKQTISNTFSQPSTWITFAVIVGIMLFSILFLPLILPTQVGEKVLPNMFYSTSLMIALFAVITTINGLDYNEMTFILTRPVSRKVYLTAKFFASLIASSLVLIVTIVLILINILYFLIKDDYSIPNVENFSWLVVFIPPILAWNFAVANAIFFKSFVKKDALITIVVVIVCILTYFSYEIIMTAIGTQPNLNVEYLVVPSVVFGALTISFMCSANSIFQKMYVRV